jgi:hypothetical protein
MYPQSERIMMDDTDRPGGRVAPTMADVLASLVWLTKDGHEAAKQRLADILRSGGQDEPDSIGATDLERLRISSVLANAQIRTLLTAVADNTVDAMVDRSTVPEVAALAGISESMISRRRSRARSRRDGQKSDQP